MYTVGCTSYQWHIQVFSTIYKQEAVDLMVAIKMAKNRDAAVSLGKQMVASNLIHHVVYEHDFEVRTQLAC